MVTFCMDDLQNITKGKKKVVLKTAQASLDILVDETVCSYGIPPAQMQGNVLWNAISSHHIYYQRASNSMGQPSFCPWHLYRQAPQNNIITGNNEEAN